MKKIWWRTWLGLIIFVGRGFSGFGNPPWSSFGLCSSSQENSHPPLCSLHGEAAPGSQMIFGTLAFGSRNPRMVWDVSKVTPRLSHLSCHYRGVSHLWGVRGDRIPGYSSRLSWFPEPDVPTPEDPFAGNSKLINLTFTFSWISPDCAGDSPLGKLSNGFSIKLQKEHKQCTQFPVHVRKRNFMCQLVAAAPG